MSKEDRKSSMSKEERDRRRATVGKAASKKIAKSEQLNFRIEEQTINELQHMAFGKGLPVGTMIRDWVLERLSQEKLGTPDMTGKALHVLNDLHVKLLNLFGASESQSRGTAPRLQGAHVLQERVPIYHTPQALPVEQSCYLLAIPISISTAAPTAAATISSPDKAKSNIEEQESRLEHFNAWEHLLTDQLKVIRRQREEFERSTTNP
jgi:hypothetical protein